MLMTIQYQNGLRVQGVLLVFNGEHMRLAVDSEHDVVELHRANSSWYTATGARVEIAAVQQIPGAEYSQHSAETLPWTIAPRRQSRVA
ncbi:MAG TPA: hypothetical protein VML19_10485 [Verrucomicrobiae bacterium]|nr:hypothetical protein [Verrucomicrobiae bacterium]